MEINVTRMVEAADEMIELSGSVMEHGPNASRITWDNALAFGQEQPLLKSDEERAAARAHFRSYGAWTEEEINGWSDAELQAITAQEVANAVRELELARDYNGAFDHTIYEELCSAGTLSGRLSYSDGRDKQWFFYLGN